MKPGPDLHYRACPTCRAVFRDAYRRCPNDGGVLVAGGGDPLVGTVLAERYRVEEVIGQGGVGRVYRCRHVRLSRQFAIKVPFGELAYERKVRRRLYNEAEAAGRLQHPNLVGVVDVGETEQGLLYLAMDLAEGDSLDAIVQGGPLDQSRALALFMQIAAGLAHAHDRGLIHRDLKPDNIIVDRDRDGDGGERPRIVDFGLAMIAHDRGHRLTTGGMVIGTPVYMAPEQCTGEALDGRTDLFALGLVLFQMLAGRLPFDGTAVEIARDNLSSEIPAIATRARGVVVDPLVEGLIRWLTEKAPARRPASAHAVLQAVSMIGRNAPHRGAAAVSRTDVLDLPDLRGVRKR